MEERMFHPDKENNVTKTWRTFVCKVYTNKEK